MNIEQIATRFTDRPHPEPGDVAIDHPTGPAGAYQSSAPPPHAPSPTSPPTP